MADCRSNISFLDSTVEPTYNSTGLNNTLDKTMNSRGTMKPRVLHGKTNRLLQRYHATLPIITIKSSYRAPAEKGNGTRNPGK